MARILVEKWVNTQTNYLLNELVDKETDSKHYAQTMYKLGETFGHILVNQISATKNISLASTVEDADFLGKGIIDVLEKNNKNVFLTVFWNKRFKPNLENQLTVAPIIKEFKENHDGLDILIVIKSIIANSCVVRTNLTRLIEESNPSQIFIVSPVLLHGAIDKLNKEFPIQISQKFNYLYFAEDTERNKEGHVLPGIGGDVYQRLGFANQDAKNKFVPQIVVERRKKRTYTSR